MKSGFHLSRLAFLVLFSVAMSGCFFRPEMVSTRHFVLSPISTNEPAQVEAEPRSVGIGLVKIPAYLMRDSIAIRTGENEIEYLDDALWAERLDQSLQQTLAQNLSKLLPSDKFYPMDWEHDNAWKREHCHERSGGGRSASYNRRRDRNGRRIWAAAHNCTATSGSIPWMNRQRLMKKPAARSSPSMTCSHKIREIVPS
jgi:hypothetical protein